MKQDTKKPFARPLSLTLVLLHFLMMLLLMTLAVKLPQILGMHEGWSAFFLAFCFLMAPSLLAGAMSCPQLGQLPRSLWSFKKSLLHAGLAALLLFPPYILAQWIIDSESQMCADMLMDWPSSLYGRPQNLESSHRARVWTQEEDLWIYNPLSAQTMLDLKFENPLGASACLPFGRQEARVIKHDQFTLGLPAGSGCVFSRRTPRTVELSSGEFLAGTGDKLNKGPGVKKSYTWLFWFIAAQFILIAFPEEFYYRGLLQKNLAVVLPCGPVFLGVANWPAIVLTSAFFALGHLIAIPEVHRLAVFFPSIVFGILYEKSKRLGGAVTFHASCNILRRLLDGSCMP